MKNLAYIKKNISLIVLVIILAFNFFLGENRLNKTEEISAALEPGTGQELYEEYQATCNYDIDIDLSTSAVTVRKLKPLTENILEIPIGRATEKIEWVADNIVEELPNIIKAVPILIQADTEMMRYIGMCGTPLSQNGINDYTCHPNCGGSRSHQCLYSCDDIPPGANREDCDDENYCVTRCWEDDDKKCCCWNTCTNGQCTGTACPFELISGQNGTVASQAASISASFHIIEDPFLPRFKPLTLFKQQYYDNQPLTSYMLPAPISANIEASDIDDRSKSICTDPQSPWNAVYDPKGELEGLEQEFWPSPLMYCFSPIQLEVKENLLKSRARLISCALKKNTIDFGELKIDSSQLFRCRDVLSYQYFVTSFLDLQSSEYSHYITPGLKRFLGCFGGEYCQYEPTKGTSEPCAEDFYCCY